MVRTPIAVACCAAAAFAAPRPQAPVVTNTALARTHYLVYYPTPGPGLAFPVGEAQQGQQDLNGDGDLLDRVLAIVPKGGSSALVVRLACDDYGPSYLGDTILLGVLESEQGGQDLNGDGDTNDDVVHLIDAENGAVTNTGLASTGSHKRNLSEKFAALAVSESAQGATDLNGDGDATDDVLHHIALANGAITNVGLVVHTVENDGDLIFGTTFEWYNGEDLNGDGDLLDSIPYLVDAVQGDVLVIGWAVDSWILVSDGFAAFGLSEPALEADLNGDGDLGDLVTHVLDEAAGTTTNTGLAQEPYYTAAPQIAIDGPYLAFRVWEAAQGQDLNRDGDQGDVVAHTLHLPTAKTFNTGLSGYIAGYNKGQLQGHLLSVLVHETAQSRDLNGDGDTKDVVPHVVRVGSGSSINLGLAIEKVSPSISIGGRLIGFSVYETDQGMQDLNGDGDVLDEILHVHDAVLGTTSNLGVVGGWPLRYQAGEDFLVYGVNEFLSGAVDLNGDGDANDGVLHLLLPQMAPHNLGVALVDFMWVSGKRVVFTAWEIGQAGADLNGDGDATDEVEHYFDVP